jgi:hypothetical protein
LKLLIPGLLMFCSFHGMRAQEIPKLMGRKITIIEPGRQDGLPKGPASVCVEGPPQRQCYIAPKGFANSPTVAIINLDKSSSAVFFSAATGGVSGWQVHFALLVPGTGKDLQDLLPDVAVSNQNQHEFLTDLAISDAPIFITADYIWGPDEGHYGEHRYRISAYILKSSSFADNLQYYLEDQYMTVHKYDLEANVSILSAEKQEILTRLRKVTEMLNSKHRVEIAQEYMRGRPTAVHPLLSSYPAFPCYRETTRHSRCR